MVGETNCIWNKGSSFMKSISTKINNPFWKEVVNCWGDFVSTFRLEDLTMDTISLWKSDRTKYKNDEISQWARGGLLYFNDLRKSSGEIMSFAKAKDVYTLRGTFLDYAGLINSLPGPYRMLKEKMVVPFMPDQIKYLFAERKGTKHIYSRLLQYRDSAHKHWEIEWAEQYGEIDWTETYQAVSTSTNSPYYRALHYKIITFTAATNKLLYKMGVIDSNICDRCRRCPETLRHKFWACPVVNNFWKEIEVWLNLEANVPTQARVSLQEEHVMLGSHDGGRLWRHVIIVGKSLIHRKVGLSIDHVKARMRQDFLVEKLAAYLYSSFTDLAMKWGPVKQFVNFDIQGHGSKQ